MSFLKPVLVLLGLVLHTTLGATLWIELNGKRARCNKESNTLCAFLPDIKYCEGRTDRFTAIAECESFGKLYWYLYDRLSISVW